MMVKINIVIENNLKKEKESLSMIPVIFILIAIFWTAATGIAGIRVVTWEKGKTIRSIHETARSFFQNIVLTRYWNALHGGLYAPVTVNTRPNLFLDVPNRDITTKSGRKLTLINPAYMTRQIAEIASEKDNVQFHITSLKPIRPANAPNLWERMALERFKEKDDEHYAFVTNKGKKYFNYMAPLWTESPCLKCHEKQGYKQGDLRGGIRVSIPAENILFEQNRTEKVLFVSFFGIWLLGIFGIFISYWVIIKDFRQRLKLIGELKKTLGEVKTLKGFIPICASCKKIRNDEGFWDQLESYISAHSDADFTHSICPDCINKLYPEYMDDKS